MKMRLHKPKYDLLTWTIYQFLGHQSKIDASPIHQRLSHEEATGTKKKYTSIIESLVAKGQSLGQITLNHVNDPTGEYEFTREFESLDGGNRKRAILEFVENKFPVTINGKKKYHKDFSKSELEDFNDIKFSVCVYENLSGPEKAEIFKDMNTTTDVSDQEIRNAAGDEALATAIRDTARQTETNPSHRLFAHKPAKSGLTYDWVGFNNKELAQEEWVARLFYYYLYGKSDICSITKDNLDHMYNRPPDEKTISKAQAHVNKVLDFVLIAANCRTRHFPGKTKISVKEANLFVRLYYYILNEYGSTFSFRTDKVDSALNFYKAVREIYDDIIDNHSDTFEWDGVDCREFDGHAKQTFGEKFSKNLNEYKYEPITLSFPVTMVLRKVNLKDYIKIKDPIRVASLKIREQLYREQGGKCAATGIAAPFEDMECDHDIPHSLGIDAGGVTQKHNLKMVLKSYNRNKSNKT
jgi:hypothetical protein